VTFAASVKVYSFASEEMVQDEASQGMMPRSSFQVSESYRSEIATAPPGPATEIRNGVGGPTSCQAIRRTSVGGRFGGGAAAAADAGAALAAAWLAAGAGLAAAAGLATGAVVGFGAAVGGAAAEVGVEVGAEAGALWQPASNRMLVPASPRRSVRRVTWGTCTGERWSIRPSISAAVATTPALSLAQPDLVGGELCVISGYGLDLTMFIVLALALTGLDRAVSTTNQGMPAA
jgi:hypothetical protein